MRRNSLVDKGADFRQGVAELKQAAGLFSSALKEDGNYSEAALMLCLTQQILQDTDNGRMNCKKAVDLDPDYVFDHDTTLATLARHANELVTTQTLLQEAWGAAYGGRGGYVRVYMHALRCKLERDPARPKYLLTEPWVGYRFCNPSGPRSIMWLLAVDTTPMPALRSAAASFGL